LRPYKYAKVYRNYGYDIKELLLYTNNEAINLFKSHKSYIAFFELSESNRIPKGNVYKIYLSTHSSEEPILDYSENHCRVALTDHADFIGTIEYIKATKCEKVITDPSRGGNAQDLAYHIKNMLGIEAYSASLVTSKEWGN